jgi:hypothetical protein
VHDHSPGCLGQMHAGHVLWQARVLALNAGFVLQKCCGTNELQDRCAGRCLGVC